MNKKSAFTIAELVIALGIVGIIVTFGLKASINNDKGIRHLYANTYHTLDRALYNATHYPTLEDPFATRDRDGNLLAGRNTGNGSNIDTDAGTKRLCLMLTEYINSVESNPCEPSAAIQGRVARLDSSQRLISDVGNDEEFTDANVQFTATNGVRFFISRRLPYDGIPDGRGLSAGDTTFFIIYADLNGPRFPNSMEYRQETDDNSRNLSREPDIFAFAALDIGRIVPLGPPEFDGRYMLSRVRYYDKERRQNTAELNVMYSKPSQPYYLMKAQAWGYYNQNSNVRDTDIIDDNPLSYNGYVKSKLDPTTRIYSFVADFFDGDEVRKVPESANLRSANVSEGGYGCIARDDEECDVIIDKFVY